MGFKTERDSMRYITIDDDYYPVLLKTIADPPDKLFYEGNIELLNEKCAAVVGSRNASSYGLRTAESIGAILGGAGVCVVSGMAYGIDMAAHKGAVKTRGRTIAVLGCGIDMENSIKKKPLLNMIKEMGLVISEYPPGTPAAKYTFPRRNRIISGISICTTVVEGNFNSGSLITAELACEQGRCVYAVPGNIDSPLSLGTNKLIKDGAVPLISAGDILSDMGITKSSRISLGMDEKRILRCLNDMGEYTISEISAKTGMTEKQAAGIVSVLEIKGLVTTQAGRIFMLNRNA